MSGSWPKGRLGDVCRVIPGYAFKSSDWQDSGIPVVKIKNITGDNSVDLTNTDFVPETILRPKLQKFVLANNDILVAMTGATAGKVGKVRTERTVLLNQRVAKIAPVEADHGFIWAVVSSQEYQERFFYLADGAAQPNMSGGQIEGVEIELPPLPVQRRIAGILSAYDELMENCQRRIRILESMTRALYREWFVHFRYPGHESVPRVDSPLGSIPQGWEVKTIADVCESVSYGYTASASRQAVGPKFLRITDIVPATIDWANVPFCEIPKDKAPKYLLQYGDIVVARTGATTGYAKRLNKLHPDTVFASYLVRARAKASVSNQMLGILMESEEYKQYIQTNIGGAAQPQANAVVLTSLRLAVPPSSVSEKFDRLVAPMIDEAELLAVKIQNLRRTRDLLLPRLLSGQVELKTN